MDQTIDGTNPQVTQSGNIINCHAYIPCSTVRAGLVVATVGALCWWWLKDRSPRPVAGKSDAL